MSSSSPVVNNAPFLVFSDESAPSWIYDPSLIRRNDIKSMSSRSTNDSPFDQAAYSACSSPLDESAVPTHEPTPDPPSNDAPSDPPSSLHVADHNVAESGVGGSEYPPHFATRRSQILSDFVGKKLYLFLDYDGTLTPIVSDPCKAVLSDSMRSLLVHLAETDRVTIGIVTGRALASVKRFVRIPASDGLNFLYAASHGFHIEASGKQLHHKVGAKFIPILREASLVVSSRLGHIPGVTLEDNEFSVSVHHRNAAPDTAEEVERLLEEVLVDYPMLRKTRGKKVFEIRINLEWDKGKAVSWLLDAMKVNPVDEETRLVYIGDDLTDEDAFRMLRQLDKNSLSVLVAEEPHLRSTAASMFVRDTNEVANLLSDILKLPHELQQTC